MATPRAGTSRSASTASSRWRPTASRSSSDTRTDRSQATVLSALRPADGALPSWGWDLPVGGGTYHALFPRAWQTFEPEALGVRLVGEQLSPVIGGDLERSALPVGVFEWWVENPGPDPLTVGLLATWADPPGGPNERPRPRPTA